MIQEAISGISTETVSDLSTPRRRLESIIYFILTVLGFSTWFFMAVPFASHRESYWWLGMLHSHGFLEAFSVGISSTYRPLAQAVAWLGFLVLDPGVFPTNVLRQTVLQGSIYGLFVLAWWHIYRAAAQRRVFAVVAFVVGSVFFSGYIQLFHIYGIFYVPVILMLGGLLRLHASKSLPKREVSSAVVAIVLVFWHPFASALFLGFYFGYYVSTIWQRSTAQHVRALLILVVGMSPIAALVFLFPRAPMPLSTRMEGFLVSYQTNEVNLFASLVAAILAVTVIVSMRMSLRSRVITSLLASGVGLMVAFKGWPVLLLWLCAVLIKLLVLRSWDLFFLTLTAALLPLGGAIGSPMYALFAIILAAYVTALEWSKAEKALAVFRPPVAAGIILVSTIIIVLVRANIDLPMITAVAKPLLIERERTVQFESILAWLHNSKYCADGIGFAEGAGNPVASVESAIRRRSRPPAGIEDVRVFWDRVLRCRNDMGRGDEAGSAIVTFGGAALADSRRVFEVEGRYAGKATVWIRDAYK
jgi:hypothetical protein